MKLRHKSIRSIFALVLVAVTVLGFASTLYNIQITNHDYYTSKNSAVKTYTVEIPAARGEIVDRNGNSLVTNRQGNSIILDACFFPPASSNEERNKIVLALINLFEKNKEKYSKNLPLVLSKGKITYKKNSKEDVETLKSKDMLNLQHYATAQNCYDAVIEKYGLENYDIKTALKIANVRYELTRLLFSVDNPVTIAEDVSDKTVAEIKENKAKYLGADVQVEAYREYADSTIAPHILGTVRAINGDEYKELKDDGYKITDQIGESGIESAMESYLRGTPGEMSITIDNDGEVTKEISKEPIQGDTVVLSVDKDLQRIAQDQLAKVCKETDASSVGAVVVENCNTGEILAAASYPSFDLNDYYDKYSELSAEYGKPLWNRFAMATYAPGSTFKPVMACAALQEGKITRNTEFYCGEIFNYYDVKFSCMAAHGYENVVGALRDSCNIFFYNCALKLGIDKMNDYCTQFGLGQKTGVEIPESEGILAGKAYRERIGSTWQSGDTVQAGIGQSDNLFTPLQLCNYSATIANGGTRYECHFVKSVISSKDGQISTKDAKAIEKVNVSANNIAIVKQGMRAVATEGGPSRKLSDVNVKVAAKTGTSQVIVNGKKRNNGFMISFAPYDSPEISVASAIELSGSGSATATISASIYKYYFQENDDAKKAQSVNSLLN